jgi:ABC-2 type transport system permease protein
MAVLSQLEYRFNLFTDAVIQPLLTGVIEVTLWSAILASTATGTLAGFPRSSYLAYALWAAFFARISTNWMYEFRMMEEIDSGTVNSVLSRPISFY